VSKTALITGSPARTVLTWRVSVEQGLHVHGIKRRTSCSTRTASTTFTRPHEKGVKMHLHHGDLTDS